MSNLGILIAYPWLALVPAIGFGLVAYRARRGITWSASVLWVLYAAYETGMARRILCSGECNIRVDLLLIYPVLLMLSVAAAVAGYRSTRRKSPI